MLACAQFFLTNLVNTTSAGTFLTKQNHEIKNASRKDVGMPKLKGASTNAMRASMDVHGTFDEEANVIPAPRHCLTESGSARGRMPNHVVFRSFSVSLGPKKNLKIDITTGTTRRSSVPKFTHVSLMRFHHKSAITKLKNVDQLENEQHIETAYQQ